MMVASLFMAPIPTMEKEESPTIRRISIILGSCKIAWQTSLEERSRGAGYKWSLALNTFEVLLGR